MGDSERPLLSAAIIVRDEEEFLRKCLASIRAVCDEIVVVDTGSADGSRAVAIEAGAVSVVRPWDDDFSAARNTALDLATGEWILYIDADEELEVDDPIAARTELANATDAISLLVRFRTRPHFSPYREYRLWRNRKDIRFVGRIHETMVPDIQRIEKTEGLAIRDSNSFGIRHYGYEGDQSHKFARDLPLLERRVVEYPERCYLWNHLGNVREQIGDSEGAVAAWTTGIELIRRRGLVDRTDVLCYAGLGLHLTASGVDATDLSNEVLTIAPWYHTGHWIAACNHIAQDRPADAIPHLRTLIAIGVDPDDPSLAYNNAMFTTWAWKSLGAALFALGDLDGALEIYEEASAADPDDLEFKTKLTGLRMMARG